MATAAAFSKIQPLPPAWAFCWDALKIFSKILGTPTRNVGETLIMSAGSCFGLGQCATFMPPSAQYSCAPRPSTCARGRNSTVVASGVSTTGLVVAASVRTTNMRLLWVITHPFGRPVVPEV